MKEKILGIIISTLLIIVSVLSVSGTMNNKILKEIPSNYNSSIRQILVADINLSNWLEQYNQSTSSSTLDEYFATSVSISNDTIVIGAEEDDVGGNAKQGSAYVFERNLGGTDNWGEVKKLIPINVIPSIPIVDGPASGNAGTSYTYTFNSTDQDGDQVSYYIKWGDGSTTGWTSYQDSGIVYFMSHTWSSQGTYIIEAKAKDTFGSESDWGTLEVTMPKNKAFNFNFPLLSWLFERFPNAFPILRYLVGQ